MVLYNTETKAKRKMYIRTKEFMENHDKESKPTQSATFMHPRWYNKPISCQMGRHKWKTDILMGIPFLSCAKCGATLYKGAVEKNETVREMRAQPKNIFPTIHTHDLIETFYPETSRRLRRIM
jgi:hypothetical protein